MLFALWSTFRSSEPKNIITLWRDTRPVASSELATWFCYVCRECLRLYMELDKSTYVQGSIIGGSYHNSYGNRHLQKITRPVSVLLSLRGLSKISLVIVVIISPCRNRKSKIDIYFSTLLTFACVSHKTRRHQPIRMDWRLGCNSCWESK